MFCKNNGEDESYYLSHTLKVWKSNKKIVGSSIPQTNFFFLVSVKNFLAFSFAESYKGKVKDPRYMQNKKDSRFLYLGVIQ